MSATYEERQTDALKERIDPTALLVQRLETWRHATNTVLAYADGTLVSQNQVTQLLLKQRKTLADPPSFSGSNVVGGTQAEEPAGQPIGTQLSVAFQELGTRIDTLLDDSNRTAAAIQQSVIPPLQVLDADLDKHYKSLRTQGLKSVKEIEKLRQDTAKHIEYLGRAVATPLGLHGAKDAKIEPYVLYRRTRAAVSEQVSRENTHAESILSVQNQFASLEAHIINVIQTALKTLDQALTLYHQAAAGTSNAVADSFVAIDAGQEWSHFSEINKELLIPSRGYQRDPAAIVFTNSDAAATKPIIEGPLQRKGTVLKNAKPGWYVLTQSGFLHQYKSGDAMQDPAPELSLFIPESQLGGLPPKDSNDLTFKIVSRDASKVIGQRHKYTFIAASYEDLVAWYTALSEVASGSTGMEKSTEHVQSTPAVGSHAENGQPRNDSSPTPAVYPTGAATAATAGLAGTTGAVIGATGKNVTSLGDGVGSQYKSGTLEAADDPPSQLPPNDDDFETFTTPELGGSSHAYANFAEQGVDGELPFSDSGNYAAGSDHGFVATPLAGAGAAIIAAPLATSESHDTPTTQDENIERAPTREYSRNLNIPRYRVSLSPSVPISLSNINAEDEQENTGHTGSPGNAESSDMILDKTSGSFGHSDGRADGSNTGAISADEPVQGNSSEPQESALTHSFGGVPTYSGLEETAEEYSHRLNEPRFAERHPETRADIERGLPGGHMRSASGAGPATGTGGSLYTDETYPTSRLSEFTSNAPGESQSGTPRVGLDHDITGQESHKFDDHAALRSDEPQETESYVIEHHSGAQGSLPSTSLNVLETSAVVGDKESTLGSDATEGPVGVGGSGISDIGSKPAGVDLTSQPVSTLGTGVQGEPFTVLENPTEATSESITQSQHLDGYSHETTSQFDTMGGTHIQAERAFDVSSVPDNRGLSSFEGRRHDAEGTTSLSTGVSDGGLGISDDGDAKTPTAVGVEPEGVQDVNATEHTTLAKDAYKGWSDAPDPIEDTVSGSNNDINDKNGDSENVSGALPSAEEELNDNSPKKSNSKLFGFKKLKSEITSAFK